MDKKDIKVYKIRRKSDGLFSTGGTEPRFTKNGKAWSSLGNLKNHMNQFIHECYRENKFLIRNPYDDCEIVTIEYVCISEDIDGMNIKEYLVDRVNRQRSENGYAKNWEIEYE